jgi:phosphatidylglycerol:prolipoprotein diacylglycerol transferase
MSSYGPISEACPGFPQDFKICGHWFNSYKVCLCVGIYVGILGSAAIAESSGVSPLRMGLGSLVCAVAGLAGARVYHVLVFARHYLQARSWRPMWDPRSGGWSVFGALLPIVPLSLLVAWALDIPAAAFWDYMSAGILAGGFWVRLGCVFNGCCGGRETTRWYGVCLHDVQRQRKRRIPVQFMEMIWWLLGTASFIALLPRSLPPGACALGVIGWYGFARFWLEPLRESPDLVAGRIRIDQAVAGLLALVAACGLILKTWTD